VAKLGLSIGVDADVTGLRKLGQQATAQLEGIRGQFGRMQGLVAAGMASPLFQVIGSFTQANIEARKTLDEMAKPFSTRMIKAEIDALHATMAAGQRMVGLGMDEPGAARIERGAQREIATALRATSPSGGAAKSFESFFSAPGDFMANTAYGLGSHLEKVLQDMGIGFRMLGGGPGASSLEKLQMQESAIRAQTGFAMAAGDTGQLEGLNLQLLRVLEAIKQNTERTR
jgi:hypothetical protein